MSSVIVPLNLPQAHLDLSRGGETVYVQCLIRKKKLVLTPEEWVRQHLIAYLHFELVIPFALIGVELSLEYNKLKKRCDIVVFDRNGKPAILVECKAPTVHLTEGVYHQIAIYNSKMNVNKMLISNGIEHVVCELIEGFDELTFHHDISRLSI